MEINLGSVIKGQKTSQSVIINNKIYKSHQAGCSACTKVGVRQLGEDIYLDITYEAINPKGEYNKSVTINFTDDTKEKIVFNVTVI